MTALTRAVSGEKQIYTGIWRFCRESGNLGSFSGNIIYIFGTLSKGLILHVKIQDNCKKYAQ